MGQNNSKSVETPYNSIENIGGLDLDNKQNMLVELLRETMQESNGEESGEVVLDSAEKKEYYHQRIQKTLQHIESVNQVNGFTEEEKKEFEIQQKCLVAANDMCEKYKQNSYFGIFRNLWNNASTYYSAFRLVKNNEEEMKKKPIVDDRLIYQLGYFIPKECIALLENPELFLRHVHLHTFTMLWNIIFFDKTDPTWKQRYDYYVENFPKRTLPAIHHYSFDEKEYMIRLKSHFRASDKLMKLVLVFSNIYNQYFELKMGRTSERSVDIGYQERNEYVDVCGVLQVLGFEYIFDDNLKILKIQL